MTLEGNSNTTIEFNDAITERYLAYAMSTIVSRSLPDVRDGLKPVHRRVLYAMYQLKLDPKNGYKKCARIIGDVIGKFHPHGEVAVYDALVRMAQTFASRYPIVDGQGNFGSIDGDAQAAMRYTEAKMTQYAMLLLKDIEDDTVDFRSNYDDSDKEPVILPAALPNILANGCEGIAVGMATSIPPHNINELLSAVIALLKKPSISINDLLYYIKGPDFPTAGVLVDSQANIANAYATGKGSFTLRCKWHIEELSRGQFRIVITEIPYQVQKRSLIEKLADLFNQKKLPFLEDIEDMSAENICIVLTPKSKTMDPNAIMQVLYKMTDLETKVHLNMNVLDDKSIPCVMDVKTVLEHFIAHRKNITLRRIKHRLTEIGKRLAWLDAMMVVYLNLDEVIAIIRNEDDPKAKLIERFKISADQAEGILNARLRSLKKLEEMEIKQQSKLLQEEKEQLEAYINDVIKFNDLMISEVKSLQKLFKQDLRRTQIIESENLAQVEIEALIEKDPLTICLSKAGWLKAAKGHGQSPKVRDGDMAQYILECMSDQKLIIFTSYGKFYTIACDKISRGKSDGDPIKLLIDMANDEHVLNAFIHKNNNTVILISTNGKGFLISSNDILAQTKNGKTILAAEKEYPALFATYVKEDGYIAMIASNRRLIVCKISEIPFLQKGKGVAIQKLKNGKVIKARFIASLEEAKTIAPFRTNNISLWLAKRGGLGRLTLGQVEI